MVERLHMSYLRELVHRLRAAAQEEPAAPALPQAAQPPVSEVTD